MKKVISFCSIPVLMFLVMTFSCTSQDPKTEEPAKIENTLQSVSYFKDTVGYNPKLLLEVFTKYNEAIDEIGYPDAGYKLWINQAEESEIRFMLEGFWPNQEVYDEIHDHQLYKEAGESDDINWDGLISQEYHRFKTIK